MLTPFFHSPVSLRTHLFLSILGVKLRKQNCATQRVYCIKNNYCCLFDHKSLSGNKVNETKHKSSLFLFSHFKLLLISQPSQHVSSQPKHKIYNNIFEQQRHSSCSWGKLLNSPMQAKSAEIKKKVTNVQSRSRLKRIS